jgi:hypothetical protein
MPPAASTAMFIGQATAIEQARAVAEVQAAIVVAQQVPRDMTRAIAQMRQSCTQAGLANKSFWRYKRSGQNLTGPTIHLARELARIWGNVQYGIHELRRDDAGGYSEMQAWAWDVQTNTRNSSTFVVPHKRDTKEGVKDIVDMRDIYENNANQGARRVREAIFAVLPPWFVDDAKDLCAKTIRDGGGKPLPKRIADALELFRSFHVRQDQIEQKLGRKSSEWDEMDVAHLVVIYGSLQRGEVRVEDEFEPPRVTVDELPQRTPPKKGTGGKATADASASTPPAPADSDDPAPGAPWGKTGAKS